jgi:hypothetical protein
VTYTLVSASHFDTFEEGNIATFGHKSTLNFLLSNSQNVSTLKSRRQVSVVIKILRGI